MSETQAPQKSGEEFEILKVNYDKLFEKVNYNEHVYVLSYLLHLAGFDTKAFPRCSLLTHNRTAVSAVDIWLEGQTLHADILPLGQPGCNRLQISLTIPAVFMGDSGGVDFMQRLKEGRAKIRHKLYHDSTKFDQGSVGSGQHGYERNGSNGQGVALNGAPPNPVPPPTDERTSRIATTLFNLIDRLANDRGGLVSSADIRTETRKAIVGLTDEELEAIIDDRIRSGKLRRRKTSKHMFFVGRADRGFLNRVSPRAVDLLKELASKHGAEPGPIHVDLYCMKKGLIEDGILEQVDKGKYRLLVTEVIVYPNPVIPKDGVVHSLFDNPNIILPPPTPKHDLPPPAAKAKPVNPPPANPAPPTPPPAREPAPAGIPSVVTAPPVPASEIDSDIQEVVAKVAEARLLVQAHEAREIQIRQRIEAFNAEIALLQTELEGMASDSQVVRACRVIKLYDGLKEA